MKNLFSNIKQKIPAGYGVYILIVISMYLLFFEEPAAKHDFIVSSVYRNLLPALAVFLFLKDLPDDKKVLRSLFSPFIVCGLVVAAGGMIGFLIYHYQSFGITLYALYGHLRFWLSLYFFYRVGRAFDAERYARRLFIHTALLSLTLSLLCFTDFFLHIWPRQIYRYGIGSIQLFFGHPSNLGARAVFLLAMLCYLYPYFEKSTKSSASFRVPAAILSLCQLMICLMTLRYRLFGFAAFFMVLYLYMVVLRKKLRPAAVLVSAAAALAVGWKRLYGFYIAPQSWSSARGQITEKSFLIAHEHFPFGSGFGTFGSRFAQMYYSPLYIKYGLMTTVGLSPEHRNYACDTFFPSILAESGWFGFCAYLGLILLLAALIFQLQDSVPYTERSAFHTFTAIILIMYELLEATGTLAFSETYSVMIALVIGLAVASLRSDSVSA